MSFQDRRPPQQIQVELEKTLMLLFAARREDWKLVLEADGKVNGCPTQFRLSLDDAGLIHNHYTFEAAADWSAFGPEQDEYFRKTSGSWFDFWTRDFHRCERHESPTPSAKYERLAHEHEAFESHLQTVEDVQREVLQRLRHGAEFRTAHKEGGTVIKWSGSEFVSSDYGESNDLRKFKDDGEFLNYVRQFFDWETARNTYPEKPTDFVAWKLILRLLWS